MDIGTLIILIVGTLIGIMLIAGISIAAIMVFVIKKDIAEMIERKES